MDAEGKKKQVVDTSLYLQVLRDLRALRGASIHVILVGLQESSGIK
jgi:hypothetical protein